MPPNLETQQRQLVDKVHALAAELGLAFSCGCTIMQQDRLGDRASQDAQDLFLQTEKLMKKVKLAKTVGSKREHVKLQQMRPTGFVVVEL